MKFIVLDRCYLALFLLILCCGCESKDMVEEDIVYGKYVLYDVEADYPIDLNFDDVKNLNLKCEIESFNKVALFVYNNNGIESVDLLWPEFLLNDKELLQGMPLQYEAGMKIDYVTVSIQYFVTIDKANFFISKEQKIVNDNSIYTFTFPNVMQVDKSKREIYFETTQQFLTNNGIEGRILKAKFRYVAGL